MTFASSIGRGPSPDGFPPSRTDCGQLKAQSETNPKGGAKLANRSRAARSRWPEMRRESVLISNINGHYFANEYPRLAIGLWRRMSR
jgi:hypothetical protein